MGTRVWKLHQYVRFNEELSDGKQLCMVTLKISDSDGNDLKGNNKLSFCIDCGFLALVKVKRKGKCKCTAREFWRDGCDDEVFFLKMFDGRSLGLTCIHGR